MKLAILSRSPNAYSTRRLKEAATQRGHDAKVLDTLKFAIDLERGSPDLYFRQKPLSTYDAVLPRIGGYRMGCLILSISPRGYRWSGRWR